MAFKLGLKNRTVRQAAKLFDSLYKTYINNDAAMVEINPLTIDPQEMFVR